MSEIERYLSELRSHLTALGLLGALIYWRRTQPEPTPGHRHLPPV